MRSEWGTSQPLAALLARQGGSIKTGPFGTTLKASEYTEVGVPLISVREIGHGSFHIDSKTPRVGPTTLARLPEYILEEGDIVFARKGGIERCALVRKQEAGWFLGSDGIRLRPPKACDARYLAYSLQTPVVKEWLSQHSTGSTMASLNQATIGRLPVVLPPARIQHAVADTLEAFDQRIDLLRQTNATLGSIAQALFKSWFIDFDPVRAKAEGREPEGMDAATAALFPAEFEESTLGLIPKGWRVLPFSETVNVIGGGTPKTTEKTYWGGDIPWFSVVDAPAPGQVFTISTEKSVTEEGVKNSSTRVLPAWTTIISARGTVGKLAMAGMPMAMNQSCYGLVPKQPGTEALVYLGAQRLVVDLQRLAHGGVFDTITRDTLASVRIVSPSPALSTAFGLLVNPVFEKIRAGGLMAAQLAEIRDALLPRLIAGKLRLPEAQAHVEEALA